MAKKKCKICHGCYEYFYYNNQRYYFCWLCKKVLSGRDDNLIEVEDPRIPKELEEQQDEKKFVV